MIKKRLASRRRKQIVLLFLVCGIVMGVMGGRRYMEKDRQNDVNSGFVMVNYYEGGEWNMILYRDPEINRYKRDPSLKMYLHEYAIQRMMGNEWKKEDVLIGKYEGAMY